MANDNPVDRLVDLVGLDPAKKPTPTQELFQQVAEEYRQGRLEVAKEAAASLFKRAIECREKMYKLRRESDAQFAKFEKELGKIMNQIESGLQQVATPPEPVETPPAAE